jgi:hypothetical protein
LDRTLHPGGTDIQTTLHRQLASTLDDSLAAPPIEGEVAEVVDQFTMEMLTDIVAKKAVAQLTAAGLGTNVAGGLPGPSSDLPRIPRQTQGRANRRESRSPLVEPPAPNEPSFQPTMTRQRKKEVKALAGIKACARPFRGTPGDTQVERDRKEREHNLAREQAQRDMSRRCTMQPLIPPKSHPGTGGGRGRGRGIYQPPPNTRGSGRPGQDRVGTGPRGRAGALAIAVKEGQAGKPPATKRSRSPSRDAPAAEGPSSLQPPAPKTPRRGTEGPGADEAQVEMPRGSTLGDHVPAAAVAGSSGSSTGRRKRHRAGRKARKSSGKPGVKPSWRPCPQGRDAGTWIPECLHNEMAPSGVEMAREACNDRWRKIQAERAAEERAEVEAKAEAGERARQRQDVQGRRQMEDAEREFNQTFPHLVEPLAQLARENTARKVAEAKAAAQKRQAAADTAAQTKDVDAGRRRISEAKRAEAQRSADAERAVLRQAAADQRHAQGGQVGPWEERGTFQHPAVQEEEWRLQRGRPDYHLDPATTHPQPFQVPTRTRPHSGMVFHDSDEETSTDEIVTAGAAAARASETTMVGPMASAHSPKAGRSRVPATRSVPLERESDAGTATGTSVPSTPLKEQSGPTTELEEEVMMVTDEAEAQEAPAAGVNVPMALPGIVSAPPGLPIASMETPSLITTTVFPQPDTTLADAQRRLMQLNPEGVFLGNQALQPNRAPPSGRYSHATLALPVGQDLIVWCGLYPLCIRLTQPMGPVECVGDTYELFTASLAPGTPVTATRAAEPMAPPAQLSEAPVAPQQNPGQPPDESQDEGAAGGGGG